MSETPISASVPASVPAPVSAASAGILLQDVTKRYPGQVRPAVGHLTLEIPAGDIVMFVGPSGCGKTTTLKMINRLIEPTSGRILLRGEDVTAVDADALRRGIGYVIQAGGLFPHLTVAANIAVVPSMLGWEKARTARRVDELLELVSLDPGLYRSRYPRELSGGQQQRVGVARALAADPPVLLMDEPFGAVDPITRVRLQDELLNIQAGLGKTIVCVTHDFDEAVKLGDWIAIFSEGGHLVQYDAPERILVEPANDFVRQFIGTDAGLKQLGLHHVRDVAAVPVVAGTADSGPRALLEQMLAAGEGYGVVVDQAGHPLAWLTAAELEHRQTLPAAPAEDLPVVGPDQTLAQALNVILVSGTGRALATDDHGVLAGVVEAPMIMQALRGRRRDIAADPGRPPAGGNSSGNGANDVGTGTPAGPTEAERQ